MEESISLIDKLNREVKDLNNLTANLFVYSCVDASDIRFVADNLTKLCKNISSYVDANSQTTDYLFTRIETLERQLELLANSKK